MNCKNCKTQIPRDKKTCPNCGRRGDAAPPTTPEGGESRDAMAARQPRLAPQPVAEVDLDQVLDAPPSGSVGPPKPAELRVLLASQPEFLEPGLELFRGDSDWVGTVTEVGEIDLLLSDATGSLCVVLISESTDVAGAISEILPRMGYVARKEGKSSSEVRGVVLLPRFPNTIDYAATAVADRVSFYTYRMALRFDRVEIKGRT